jgi:hypothetical protein
MNLCHWAGPQVNMTMVKAKPFRKALSMWHWQVSVDVSGILVINLLNI